MKKLLVTTTIAFLCGQMAFTQEADMKRLMDSISASYKYQTGEVKLSNGIATLQVPQGWRYLDGAQSDQVLTDLWGNPPGQNSLGMLFPENLGPLDSASYAFNLSWEEMGYVKDGDADDINYDDLLKGMQKDSETENKQRQEAGYEAISVVGWAAQPYYDKDKKVLHWAKELRFGDMQASTLNYDVRVLGRKGVLSMNAIGSMDQLPIVQASIPGIISAVAYTDGNRYSDFSKSSGDKIAAWTIGGLVAGKVLAKVGIFAILAKFGKLIIVALIAGGAAIWRFITGRRKQEEESNFASISDGADDTTQGQN